MLFYLGVNLNLFKFVYKIMIKVDLTVWGLWEPTKLNCYYTL